MSRFAGTGPIEPDSLYGPCRKILFRSHLSGRVGYFYVYWNGEAWRKGGCDPERFAEINDGEVFSVAGLRSSSPRAT